MALGDDHSAGDTGHVATHNMVEDAILADRAFHPRWFPTGEAAIVPSSVDANTVGMSSGTLKLTYFTALTTETITSAVFYLGSQAAGGSPTVNQIGIWTADNDGALLSLVAQTTNDAALVSSGINTRKSKALASSWSKTRGQRYAAGMLYVNGSSSTAPTYYGCVCGFGGLSPMSNDQQRFAGQVSGLSTLPTSRAAAQIDIATSYLQFLFLR